MVSECKLNLLLEDILYIELILICFANCHCLDYHIKHHHSRNEVLQKICILLVKHYMEYLLTVFLLVLLVCYTFWSNMSVKVELRI